MSNVDCCISLCHCRRKLVDDIHFFITSYVHFYYRRKDHKSFKLIYYNVVSSRWYAAIIDIVDS